MIGIERLTHLIKLVLLTAYLKGEKPVSLIIISDRPESGKTQIINQFNKANKVAIVTDATAFGIWRDFHKRLEDNEINHLLFTDFLTAISRQKSTVDSLITTLNPLIEEGLAELHTGFLQPLTIKAPHPIGVILAMIKGPFEKHKEEWANNGFLSRLLVCSYRYSDDMVKTIFRSILDSEYRGRLELRLNLPTSLQDVEMPFEMGVKVQLLFNSMKEEEKPPYGFRLLKDLRRLAMANAIDNDRHAVTQKDIDMLKGLSKLLSEKYSELEDV